jgi:hypothetical protein
MALALLERETLDRDEINLLARGETLPPLPPPEPPAAPAPKAMPPQPVQGPLLGVPPKPATA